MENSLKVLTMAAGIFMTCFLISFSLLIMREGKQIGNRFLEGIREEERLFGENKWTRYDGNIVSGAEVINAVRRFQKELSVIVNNRMIERVYTKSNIFKVYENSSNSISYIEPFDDYIGSIIRNENGEIEGIQFIKRG